ncbi:MAG: hypothetical protein GX640_20150 [Fibrobacter sp.]|nr:hypothetical protein [Fibrobacter sp.]
MNIEYYYFIVAVLIPRIFSQWKDESVSSIPELLGILMTELLLLTPLFTIRNYLIILPILLIYHVFQFIVQRNKKNLLSKRIIELLFFLTLSSFVFGIFLPDITFNSFIAGGIKIVFEHNALFPRVFNLISQKTIFYLLGVVLLTNEINNIIRYILNLLKTVPLHRDDQQFFPDDQELNRGKIIGVIERILFFFFVITDNYASIAFILTAKGFTRFKELDDKNFAEYVLIGTLLSSGLAIFCGVLILELTKNTAN